MYYSYSDYLKNKYGEKVYKLPVNLPLTCPNRLCGKGGCDFCSEAGTGFEALNNSVPVKEQLEKTRVLIEKSIMHISLSHIFKIIQIPFYLLKLLSLT